MGSRYGGLKQMDPMGPNGETVLDYSVYDAIRAGFGRVVFIIREDFAEAFRQGVGSRFADVSRWITPFRNSTTCLKDSPSRKAGRNPGAPPTPSAPPAHLVKGSFAVINADDFYGSDAYVRAAEFLSAPHAENENAHYAMIGYPLINTLSDHGDVNRGICTRNADRPAHRRGGICENRADADGVVRGNALDGTRREVCEVSPVSMNFWAFTHCFIDHLETEFTDFLKNFGNVEKSENYIPTVVDALIRAGKADCAVLDTTSHWFGVTYPEDKQHVVASIRKLIETGEYPADLSHAASHA